MQSKQKFARQTMTNKIKHTGIIDSIEDGRIKVRIVQVSACASCKIANHCNASESKEKLIDVYADTHKYEIGQEVVVTASKDMANRALALGFGLPFLIMISVLIVTLSITGNEVTAALSAIAALLPYYISLWLARDKIALRISFQIEQ